VQRLVEAAAIGQAREAVLVRQFFQLALHVEQPLFGALALADVEHEPDQRMGSAVRIAHHMHDVADPDEFPVLAQGTVIGFMVHARL